MFAAICQFFTELIGEDLNLPQITGLQAGLTYEQVNHSWFDYPHALAAQRGIPYECYAGLSYHQVWDGILHGLSREQVEDLNATQIEGLHSGLTREQVNFPWFSYHHVIAAERGLPYDVYANATKFHPEIIFYVHEVEAEQILAIVNHALPLQTALAYEGHALQEALREYREQQRLALSMATHTSLGSELVLSDAGKKVLREHNLVEHIGRFI